VDESDLSIYKTANEHIFGIGYSLKDGENLVALWVSPPAAFNPRVDNRLG
jgi:hypothetical protein